MIRLFPCWAGVNIMPIISSAGGGPGTVSDFSGKVMHQVVVWGPAAFWVAVLFFLSEWESPGIELGAGFDGVVHFSLYTVLGFTLAWARLRGARRYERDGSIPLQPYVEAIRAYLQAAPQDSLDSLVGPYANELSRSFPEIAAHLTTTPSTDNLAIDDDPQIARQRHLDPICHLFGSIAVRGPQVLFLDDLQWAPSIEALQALAQRVSSQPLLLIGAYRDAELREKPSLSRTVLAMNRDRLFQPLALHRLDADETGRKDVRRPVSSADARPPPAPEGRRPGRRPTPDQTLADPAGQAQ